MALNKYGINECRPCSQGTQSSVRVTLDQIIVIQNDRGHERETYKVLTGAQRNLQESQRSNYLHSDYLVRGRTETWT